MTPRRLRPALALLTVAAGLAAHAAPAAALDTTVEIPGRFFDPSRLTVVSGDRVTWANGDILTHNVRATDGSFASPDLTRGARFTAGFTEPGDHPYFCSIHAFMSGIVTVVPVTLAGPAEAVLDGAPARLTGRAPATTGHITIERSLNAGGDWADTGIGAEPAADGSFTVTVPAVEGVSFRALAAGGPSPAVTPRVIARVALGIMLHRAHGKGGRSRVVATVSPATPGFSVSLQLYSPERFAWRRVATARVGKRGTATIRVRGSLHRRARFLLSSRPGGPALAYSRAIDLRTGRTTRSPDAGDHASHAEPGSEATTSPAAGDAGMGH
jgi:plastocyanin